jgi:hypothetical protein
MFFAMSNFVSGSLSSTVLCGFNARVSIDNELSTFSIQKSKLNVKKQHFSPTSAPKRKIICTKGGFICFLDALP